MSTIKRPVGRRSAAVYRRRRIMVLLVLAAIVAVVLLIILRPGSGGSAKAGAAASTSAHPSSAHPGAKSTSGSTPRSTPVAHPATSSVPAPSPTPAAPQAGQPCAPQNVDVEAITDAASYGAGARPLLSLSLTNTGAQMCTIDAGTATMVFTISSGHDQYWTSTDCQTNPVHTVVKLEPSTTLTTTPIPWDRTRSAKATCGKQRPPVPAGGASYHLAVSIDGIPAKATKQFLLNG
ncbi:MAG TPA: hypothetical protein VGC45_14085 [Gryllotalpicola sp.]